MNPEQARYYSNLKVQTRIKEAQCKALSTDKYLSNFCQQDIKQLYEDVTFMKAQKAYIDNKLNQSRNTHLKELVQLFSASIKSNTKLSRKINSTLENIIDGEDMLQTAYEDTILTINEAINNNFEYPDNVVDDNEQEGQISVESSNDRCKETEEKKQKMKSVGFDNNVYIKPLLDAEEHTKTDDCCCIDVSETEEKENDNDSVSIQYESQEKSPEKEPLF